MKDRTLKELYEILWNHIKDKNYIHSLCDEIYDLKSNSIINPFDYNLIYANVSSNPFQRIISSIKYLQFNLY